jgi:hypothetical protein
MVKAPGMMAKAPRIIGSSLQPPRILAKAPHIMPKPPPYNAKSTNKMPFDHFNPAMALTFHERRPKMKDDHIAYLPYA